MSHLHPNISEILEVHMRRQLDGKTGLRRRRIETAEGHLRRCLEETGERVLVDADLALLGLERQFAPADAFARVMKAGDLLFVLNVYVSAPWLLEDLRDRAVQLRFADALETFTAEQRLVDYQDYGCPMLELRISIMKAKVALSRERLMSR